MVNADTKADRRRLRIRYVGKILKWLSALTILAFVAATISTLFSPVVSVGTRYSDPLASPDEQGIEGDQTQSQDPREHGNRLYLEMAGSTPEVRVFSYHPGLGGRSTILEEQEWLARLAAFTFSGYNLLGACLFFRLFQLFEYGNTLTRQTASLLKWIGLWMLGLWGFSILYQFSKPAWDSSPSGITLFEHLPTGLFICLIAWVMEEGRQIAEEQALTI